ncbi:imidazolonepropionase [Shewanella sp.]|nr:imidazolonepropionase [Shewanella sp.]
MSWDQIWIDINIATMSPSIAAPYGAIKNAALAVKDGKIAWIGKRSELPEFDVLATPIYKGKGGWLTPGLIDAHTQLVFAGNHSADFEQQLQGHGSQKSSRISMSVKACRDADDAELFELARQRLNALAKEGVTTVEIKSGYGLNTQTELTLLRVARELGKHHHVDVHTTFFGAHAVPPEYTDNPNAYVDLVINQMLPKVVADNLADAVDVSCGHSAFSLTQAQRILTAAKAAKLNVKLHADNASTANSASLAAEQNVKAVAHIEHFDEQSVKKLSQSGSCAMLLPGEFYAQRETQHPPIDLLRKYQVPMVIASNYNPISAPLCSSRLMLNMACTLLRLTPEEALAGMTRNAAKALGIDAHVGVLDVGMNADFCLWNISTPAELAYTYGVASCVDVVKNGNLVHQ